MILASKTRFGGYFLVFSAPVSQHLTDTGLPYVNYSLLLPCETATLSSL